MREEAFRAFLAQRLGGRAVVSSYLSNARLVERRLGISLDLLHLDERGIPDIRDRLIRVGVAPVKASDCGSALRQYAAMLKRLIDGGGPLATNPPPSAPPRRSRARHPIISAASVPMLMGLYGDIIAELRERGISRTANGPVGDYAEHLFATAFGWELAPNSATGYDAIDRHSMRYQIKARRLSTPGASRQLSAIRRLSDQSFHILAAVLFDDAMTVSRAALIPYATVVSLARPVEHTNSWKLMLSDRVWALPGVIDATDRLRAAA